MEFSTKIVCFSKGVSLANMNMKRVTLVNIVSNIILQVVTIISGFIIPKLILLYFGSNVNGLVSSLNQFLGYISLLEGGITGVVSANFYKPLIENDTTKLSAIIVTAKSFFDKVGIIFVLYSVGLAVVYPLIFKTEFSWKYIFTLTLILSISLLIQYMFSVTLRTLLVAAKRIYIVAWTQIIIIILNIVLSCVCVKLFPSIHIFKFISGALFILQPLVFGAYVRKHFDINWEEDKDSNLLKQRWNGFAINLAAFIHFSTDITVLTVFTDLKTVSVYGVYALVTSGLSKLIQSITSAISPTIGQAYAKQDLNELHFKLSLYEYIAFVSIGFFFSIAGLLITPFVILYTKGVTDANYYQPVFGILIVISEALYLIKFPHLSLAYSANKFKELTVPAFVEAGINIVISVILVLKFGLIGVAIGTICGMTYRMIAQVSFTTKLLPSRKQNIFYKKLGWILISTIIGILLCVLVFPIKTISLQSWIIHGFVYSVFMGAIYALCSAVFFKSEVRYFLRYLGRRK